MSTATDFLNGWVQENVNATMYEDPQMAEHLANDCLWEAKPLTTRSRIAVDQPSIGSSSLYF
jgi:hypothetical protein